MFQLQVSLFLPPLTSIYLLLIGLLLLQNNNNYVEAQQDRAEVSIRVSGACGTGKNFFHRCFFIIKLFLRLREKLYRIY